MKQLKFNVELITPTLLSNGEPEGLYDDSFIQDEYKLPVFPAKRLKGLLRESCTELLEWSGNQSVKEIIDLVFGKVGESNSTSSSKIRVFNADIVDRNKWVEIVKDKNFDSEILEAIDSFFSLKIAQTQIEDDGIAKEGSLRQFKLLAPKHEAKFETKISFSEGLTDEIINLIKIGLKNIRRVGKGRNRGWGKVKIVLINEELPVDFNLKNLVVPNMNFSQSEDHFQSEKLRLDVQDMQLETVALKLTAKSNLIFPKWSGDENTVSTKDYIPGSMLWGAFAGKYIQSLGKGVKNIMEDSIFYQLFYNGGLQFEPAFPIDEERVYKYPARHWVQSKLEPQDPYRNICEGQIPSGKPINKLSFFDFNDGKFWSYEIHKSQSFHNSRGTDEKSRMSGTNQDSGIYYYESVNKGATFYTEIKVYRGLKDALLLLLKDGKLKVGKSKNNQFGMVSVEEIKPIDSEKDISGNELDIVFESPVILMGENGFNNLSIKNIAHNLNIDENKINQFHIRNESIQRFQGNLNILLLAFEAITPGSSLRVEDLSETDLKSLINRQETGIGLETEKGFGQFRIEKVKKGIEFTELKDSKNTQPSYNLNKTQGDIAVKIRFELEIKRARNLGFVKAGGNRGQGYKNGVHQALGWLASCKGDINEKKWSDFKSKASKKVKQKFIERHNLFEIYPEKKVEKVYNEPNFSSDEINHLKYIAALAYIERLKSNLN